MAEGFCSSSTSDGEFHSENSEDLSYGDLTSVPEFLFPRAKDIRSLLLHNNEITTLPPTFSLFKNLISVDLSNNFIDKICDEIVHLKSLRTLVIKNNGLKNSSIPKDFGRLKSIETLNFSGNNFGELPPQFTELKNLRSLFLGGNQISQIPNTVKNLKRLEILYLGGNLLTEIPAEVGSLHNLLSLTLCDNQLQSLPPTLIHLRKLQSLSLHNNQLSTLPPELVSLNLIELSLRNNPLVVKFVQDMIHDPPSLLELAGRVVKIERVKYSYFDLPKNLIKYLESAQRCVNPKCKGVYFTSRVESVKFVDFCGKYRLPLMQYLCSPTCSETPVVSCHSDTETDDEDNAKAMIRRVLLG